MAGFWNPNCASIQHCHGTTVEFQTTCSPCWIPVEFVRDSGCLIRELGFKILHICIHTINLPLNDFV